MYTLLAMTSISFTFQYSSICSTTHHFGLASGEKEMMATDQIFGHGCFPVLLCTNQVPNLSHFKNELSCNVCHIYFFRKDFTFMYSLEKKDYIHSLDKRGKSVFHNSKTWYVFLSLYFPCTTCSRRKKCFGSSQKLRKGAGSLKIILQAQSQIKYIEKNKHENSSFSKIMNSAYFDSEKQIFWQYRTFL